MMKRTMKAMARTLASATSAALFLAAGPTPRALAVNVSVRTQGSVSVAAPVAGNVAQPAAGTQLSPSLELGTGLSLAPAAVLPGAAQAPAAAVAATESSVSAAADAATAVQDREETVGAKRDALPAAAPATFSQETRAELSGVRDAVGALPNIAEASPSSAHGAGVTIADLITRTRSRSGADAVSAVPASIFSSGLKPSGLSAAGSGVAVPAPSAGRASGRTLTARATALAGAVAAAVLIALTFAGFATGVPAIVTGFALLLMTGTVADKGGAKEEGGLTEAAVAAILEGAPAEASAASAEEAAFQAEVEKAHATIAAVESEVAKVIVGQQELVQATFDAIIAREHVLAEGMPGLAKTLLMNTIASTIDGMTMSRIQGAADLLPSGIVGAEILEDDGSGKKVKVTMPGPVFANIVLYDEINRSPPKANGIMLQAMQERQVTLGRQVVPLPSPFMVLATQNPIEQEGTYGLPEAQLDRFLFKVVVPSPNAAELEEIGNRHGSGDAIPVEKKATLAEVVAVSNLAKKVKIAPVMMNYIARLVEATSYPDRHGMAHLKDMIRTGPNGTPAGASPRAVIGLAKAARIQALRAGRSYVQPEDVRVVAHRVLRHRILMSYDAKIGVEALIDALLDGISPDGAASPFAAAAAGAPSPVVARAKAKAAKSWWKFWGN